MTSTITKQEYSVYYGISELKRLQTAHSLAFDTETLQLQPEEGKLRLIQLGSFSSRTIVVIDCFELERSDWNYLEEFFSSTNRYWLAHNAVFDLGWLQEHGIHPEGFVRCSMLASRLLTNGIPQTKHGLDALAKRQLDMNGSKEQQKSNWGAEYLSKEHTLLRVLRYPPIKGPLAPKALRAAAHEDINLITLLPAADEPGLELKSKSSDEWFPLEAPAGSIVVNIGDMLQELTDGSLPSTSHRVVNPKQEHAQNSRMTAPVFCHPHPELILSERYSAEDYLSERLKEINRRA